jgi:putative phosphoesterase
MRIGLLSDTHGFLDDAILEHLAGCDEIWHAGDLGSTGVLDRLAALKPLRAVFGNIDGPEIRGRIPEDLEWSSAGLRVYMTHIGGHPGRYDPRARRELQRRKPGLFVCGHSHIVRVVRDQKLDLLHLNPGAAGHAGWHLKRTLMRFEISAGQIGNCEVIELGKRGRGAA